MSMQRIIAVLGGAVLATTMATTLIAEPSARADQEQPMPGQRPTDMTVHFDFDSAELDAQAKQSLDNVARWLQENPQRTVVVAGYTDQVGEEDYNLVLGKERARQTKEYLVSQGVAPERIVTVSFGEDFPASSVDAQNRRIVFFSTRPGSALGQGAMTQPQEGYGEGYGEQPAPDQYAEPEYEGGEPPPAGADAQAGQGTERDGDFLDMNVEDEEAPAVLFGSRGKRSEDLVMPYGLSVSAGGGVLGFVDSDTRDIASAGTAWDVRVMLGTRRPIAVEAAYFGASQGVDVVGLNENASLLATGLEANLRVNILQRGRLQPYLLSGVGWTRYSLRNVTTNTSSIKDSESMVHVPFAVGVGFRATRSFLVDLRGTVRAAFRDELQRPMPNGMDVPHADLSTWAVTARLGWEF